MKNKDMIVVERVTDKEIISMEYINERMNSLIILFNLLNDGVESTFQQDICMQNVSKEISEMQQDSNKWWSDIVEKYNLQKDTHYKFNGIYGYICVAECEC
jgi:CXXX repeat modification system protein